MSDYGMQQTRDFGWELSVGPHIEDEDSGFSGRTVVAIAKPKEGK